MAKEMLIIFVYDSQMLQKEEDDPSTAILYFHPTWVSDQQKAALCGQLMGTVHCIKTVFQTPKIVSLTSGKFFVKEYGRYLLALGTDRNIADWLLEHRAKTVCSLLNFFHQDVEVMSKLYDDIAKLSAKLYQLFETYLKYLFLGGNIFSYSPLLKLPKSANNVFLEAMQILQCCQESNHVMGGTLLYHNKVVATQLGSVITKQIVLTDPYRIKCPAEVPTVAFDLPLGVQLFYVYIPNQDYFTLNEEAAKSRNIFQHFVTKPSMKFPTKLTASKEPVISAMKRDQSIIFTAVPEEDSEPSTCSEQPKPVMSRPKFLNLKTTINDDSTKKIAASVLNCGQTTVCSTPMTDLNKVVYLKPMSICIDEPKMKTPNNDTISNTTIKKIVTPSNFTKKFSSVFDLINSDSTPDKIEIKYKTICDPNYPIFKSDGTVVSVHFYKDYLSNEMKRMAVEIDKEKLLFTDFDSTVNVPIEPIKESAPSSIPEKRRTKEHRKSLTLPLKPLNLDSSEKQASPIRRHSSAGVLLTPLMSKLSSFDERSSGFCSRDATPCEYKMFTPTTSFPFKKHVRDANVLHKCVLFVCGQQDMVIALLLRDEACSSSELLRKLWEICTENLGKLERQLHHCLETWPSGAVTTTDVEPYSYLHLDSDWDTIHRGGPWGSAELGALTWFHRDFQKSTNTTEILMRCCDGVIYGHQCGKSQVFYHQAAAANAGLPPPSDAMSNVPIKAKRRLERDHSIILI